MKVNNINKIVLWLSFAKTTNIGNRTKEYLGVLKTKEVEEKSKNEAII